jgi:hypothetical protein
LLRGCRFDYFMEALYDQRHTCMELSALTGLLAGNQIRERSLEGVAHAGAGGKGRKANEGLLLQPTWDQVLLTDSQKKKF